MEYHYIASQSDGKITEGDTEGANIAEVLHYLTSRNLKPVSIKPAERKLISLKLFQGRINMTDQIFLSKYLALMLKIGTGLLQAINILIDDFDKPAVKSFLIEIKSNLEKGQPFYVTFEQHPKVFNQVYVNLVKAGETSGNLESVFDHLTVSLSKDKNLRDEIRSALIYPIMLLVASIAILTFLVVFALPRIANVFMQSGFDPPTFSKIVFSVGLFFGQFGLYFIVIGLAALLIFFYAYRHSLVFKKLVMSMLGEIPAIRNVLSKIALQRFASTFASLIKAGLPMIEALEITAAVVGNPELKEALIRVAKEGLAKGSTIGEAFRREPTFPKTVVNLMAISEKAGHIEEVLGTLADFYGSEIDNSLKILVSFLEPVMLLFIGAIIGLIALAIIIPIYQLATQF